MATKYVDFTVTGDPAMARATAERALAERQFTVNWHDDWTGVAERGNKVMTMMVGAFAPYFKVGLRLMNYGPAQTIVRIERLSSGWAGGVIGASRTADNMRSLRAELEATFAAAGVLLNVTDG